VAQQTQNSHYIARHLTRPWEFTHPKKGPRHLWYYDFDNDAFGVESSRNLYTVEAPWSDEVEGFLNRYLETPLSRFLHRFNLDRRAQATQEELRAMKLSVMLQVERTGVQGDIEKTARQGELYINTLVSAADEIYRFVHIPLRQERLFFPSTGIIMLPLVGPMPIAVPLHPSYLTALVPVPHDPLVGQIKRLRENEDAFTALSAGLEPNRRVVIPGSLWGRESERTLRPAIRQARGICKRVSKAVLGINSKLLGTPTPTPRQWVEAQHVATGAAIAIWAKLGRTPDVADTP
jgi:hypothetical protein